MISEKQAVENFVRRKIRWLDEGEASSRAALAKLRRGLGKSPAEIPEIWEITMTWNGDAAGVPDALQAKGDGKTTRAEWAIHTALTLYALHRQGKGASMNDAGDARDADPDGDRKEAGPARGNSFGAALALLRSADPGKEPGLIRRFNAALTANGPAEFSRHALGMIQLLRAAERPVKIDYPAFAGDLFQYQFPEARDRVILKWGRDFWRGREDPNTKTGANKDAQRETIPQEGE